MLTGPLTAWLDEEKPRERFIANGADALSDAELIAILLNTGYRGTSVVDLAKHLLNESGGIFGLARYSVHELAQYRGIGLTKAVRLLAACELGRRRERSRIHELPMVQGVQDASRIFSARLRDAGQECFYALYLDKKHRVLDEKCISRGNVDQTLVHPRELLRPALACSASAVIVAHNHPSGDPMPSAQDIALTHQLEQAAALMGIQFLDHIIIGDGENISFAEKGYLKNREKNNRIAKSQNDGVCGTE